MDFSQPDDLVNWYGLTGRSDRRAKLKTVIASSTEAQIRSLSLIQLEDLGEALLDFSQPDDWLDLHCLS